MTIGLVFPPLTTGSTPNSTEFIAQLVAPVTYGWTGLSVGGTMADSLLFTLWPYNNEVILGPRWTRFASFLILLGLIIKVQSFALLSFAVDMFYRLYMKGLSLRCSLTPP